AGHLDAVTDFEFLHVIKKAIHPVASAEAFDAPDGFEDQDCGNDRQRNENSKSSFEGISHKGNLSRWELGFKFRIEAFSPMCDLAGARTFLSADISNRLSVSKNMSVRSVVGSYGLECPGSGENCGTR